LFERTNGAQAAENQEEPDNDGERTMSEQFRAPPNEYESSSARWLRRVPATLNIEL
jgi:hypothetical protein